MLKNMIGLFIVKTWEVSSRCRRSLLFRHCTQLEMSFVQELLWDMVYLAKSFALIRNHPERNSRSSVGPFPLSNASSVAIISDDGSTE